MKDEVELKRQLVATRERLNFVLRGIMKTSHEGAYHTGAVLHNLLGLKWTENHNLEACYAAIDVARKKERK